MLDNTKTIRGKSAYKQGKWTETLARLYLACKGYKCLGRRIQTPVGEIDILCTKAGQLIIVEVKSARNIMQTADSPILYSQKNRLIKAAEYLYARMQKKYSFHQGIRLDAVFIDPKSFAIKHHRNITQ